VTWNAERNFLVSAKKGLNEFLVKVKGNVFRHNEYEGVEGYRTEDKQKEMEHVHRMEG